MTYQAADFYLTENTGIHAPIAGVVANVYSQDGKIFYTQSTTDAQGHVGFLLDDGVQYQIRFFKFQVAFQNPTLFGLVSPPGANTFDVAGTVVTPPSATDPRLCRTSGFFRNIDGSPAANVDIQIIAKFKPLLLDGAALLTERVANRTDDKGYMQIDLIRLGEYDVTIQGMEDLYRTITVPDAPKSNLPDLLFPVVSQVSFSTAGPYVVSIGTDFPITPTVLASDGEVLKGTATQDVIWDTDDNSVCVAMDMGDKLVLRAFKAGTTNITAVRRDKSIVRYPDLPIQGQPVAITVP